MTGGAKMTTPNNSTDGNSTEALRERLRGLIPESGKDGPTRGVNHIAVFAKDL